MLQPRNLPCLLLAASLALAGCSASSPTAPKPAIAGDLRPTINLDPDWRFVKSDVPDAAHPDFEDSDWDRVSVPHTWNVDDGADGGANYYRGPAWYRRTISLTADQLKTDRRQILRFGAASLVADVYVNGHKVGTHRGGYAAFTFDVTEFLHAGDNVLSVRVDNTNDRNVPPLSGDFTVYGGLYRDVQLVSVPDVGISTQDEGSPGVYLTPTLSPSGAGDVKVSVELRNTRSTSADVRVTTSIVDAGGREVESITVPATAAAGKTTEVVSNAHLSQAHPWDGVRDPYLYSAVIEVAENGRTVDRITQPLGFRTFEVDAEKGLILNGQHYDVHGVNKHQGRPSVGYADTPGMRAQDFAWLHDLGATGVRLAHYQHPDDEYGWCDRFGIVAWAELCLVNRLTDTPEFRDNAQQQLRELIKQSYNHPSILFWSMYNEPAVNARSGTDAQWHLVADLNRTAKDLDPLRITTGAVAGNGHKSLNYYMDTLGENFYTGWYGGKPTGWNDTIAAAKKREAGHKIAVSEYGAGASVKQHQVVDLSTFKISQGGKWHPEEYQALVHEQAWRAMKDQDWIWGKFVWVMFDFSIDSRNEGDHAGINDKGLVTGDRRTPKDAYFFYKANWSAAPVVHIADSRFAERLPGPTQLKLYSNCEDPKLTLNGVEVPLRNEGTCVFTAEVDLREGTASLKATGKKGDQPAQSDATWTVKQGAATRHNTAPGRQ